MSWRSLSYRRQSKVARSIMELVELRYRAGGALPAEEMELRQIQAEWAQLYGRALAREAAQSLDYLRFETHVATTLRSFGTEESQSGFTLVENLEWYQRLGAILKQKGVKGVNAAIQNRLKTDKFAHLDVTFSQPGQRSA